MLILYLTLAFLIGYTAGSLKGEKSGRTKSLQDARKWGQALRRLGK